MRDEVDITPADARQKVIEGALLVDVREQTEWSHSHIDGSVHLPLSQLQRRAGELATGAPIVFLCRVGGRSRLAADAFRASGLSAFSMAGGLLAWDAAGLPLTPAGAGVAAH